MFTNRPFITSMMALLPMFIYGAVFVLSNTTLGACGTPGGC